MSKFQLLPDTNQPYRIHFAVDVPTRSLRNSCTLAFEWVLVTLDVTNKVHMLTKDSLLSLGVFFAIHTIPTRIQNRNKNQHLPDEWMLKNNKGFR